MRIAYVNTYYKTNHTGGGHVHMGQFVANATALGHEVWAYPRQGYPEARTIPTNRTSHIKTMRQMDVLYVRVENRFPEFCTWALPPRRWLYGFSVVVWEFNTVPEAGLLKGRSEADVSRDKNSFIHYGSGCDLAVCMTCNLAEYVRENFGVRRTLIVPNGSDPDLFHPNVPVAHRMKFFEDKFNVVWIGSGKESWHDTQLIRAAAQLLWDADSKRNILFHIIGPDMAGVMADMPPNVYYWGAEFYNKLPHWLAGADVGLSLYRPGPADYATPLKVFDYMASGLAIVSTPQPFMRDLFEKYGQSDLIVESGNPGSLVGALLLLSADQERVGRIGKLWRELLISQFTWRRAAKDTMNEIESIFQERKKSHGRGDK